MSMQLEIAATSGSSAVCITPDECHVNHFNDTKQTIITQARRHHCRLPSVCDESMLTNKKRFSSDIVPNRTTSMVYAEGTMDIQVSLF